MKKIFFSRKMAGQLLLLGLLVLFVWSVFAFSTARDRLLNPWPVMSWALFFALFTGVVVGGAWKIKTGNPKMQPLLIFMFLSLFLMPLYFVGIENLNRLFDTQPVYSHIVGLTNKLSNAHVAKKAGRESIYLIEVESWRTEGRKERLRVKEKTYRSLYKEAPVEIIAGEGFFGSAYIRDVRVAE